MHTLQRGHQCSPTLPPQRFSPGALLPPMDRMAKSRDLWGGHDWQREMLLAPSEARGAAQCKDSHTSEADSAPMSTVTTSSKPVLPSHTTLTLIAAKARTSTVTCQAACGTSHAHRRWVRRDSENTRSPGVEATCSHSHGESEAEPGSKPK